MNDQKLMVMRVIWGALLSGTVMFLAVGFLVVTQRAQTSPPTFILLPVLAASAFGLAVSSLALPPFLLRQALLGLKLPTTEVPSPGPSNTRRRGKRFADAADVRSRLVTVAQPSFIIGMALAEAVALHGFVLLFLGFDLALVVPFFVVCWGLMSAKFPRLHNFAQAAENAYDAELV